MERTRQEIRAAFDETFSGISDVLFLRQLQGSLGMWLIDNPKAPPEQRMRVEERLASITHRLRELHDLYMETLLSTADREAMLKVLLDPTANVAPVEERLKGLPTFLTMQLRDAFRTSQPDAKRSALVEEMFRDIMSIELVVQPRFRYDNPPIIARINIKDLHGKVNR